MNRHGLFFRFAMTRPGEMSHEHRHEGDSFGLGFVILALCVGVGVALYFLV